MKMMTASVVPAMATMTTVPTAVAAMTTAVTTAVSTTALGENEGRGKCCRRGNRAGCDKGN